MKREKKSTNQKGEKQRGKRNIMIERQRKRRGHATPISVPPTNQYDSSSFEYLKGSRKKSLLVGGGLVMALP